ncbi:MAG: hypothetical protein KDA42_09565 [Planctomycetales bacterium]|nr:hypothetical protein [Planctomycetales bacterium]
MTQEDQPAGPEQRLKFMTDDAPQEREWTIPQGARKVLPAEMVRIAVLQDKTGDFVNDHRTRIAAAQAVASLNRQNQTYVKAREADGLRHGCNPEQARTRLIALAERLQLGKLATAS